MPAFNFACALVPLLVCVAAGSTIGSRFRQSGADMLVGFGLLTGLLAILAVTTRAALSWLTVGLAGASVVALLIRRQFPAGRSTWIAVALLSPMLLKAAVQEPVAWDDFWNWLPSAAYEFFRDSLPWRDLPPSLSIFPGYPQGMPLMIAAASFIAGRFVESAGPVINVLLLAASSALLADALTAVLIRRGRLYATEPPAVLVVTAVLVTTLFNPGLDGSVALSSYADCGTMVAVGALGLILISLRDPTIPRRRAILQLPRMLGPGILLFAVWRWYVVQNLPDGEQNFRPLTSWNFTALRSTFASISLYIANAPLFHALMWSVAMAGVFFFLSTPAQARRGAMASNYLRHGLARL